MMGLACADKQGNKVLCGKCCDELIASDTDNKSHDIFAEKGE